MNDSILSKRARFESRDGVGLCGSEVRAATNLFLLGVELSIMDVSKNGAHSCILFLVSSHDLNIVCPKLNRKASFEEKS